jgi:hypothetical protein
MPKIGDTHYAYTEKGKAQYKKAKKRLAKQEGGEIMEEQMGELMLEEEQTPIETALPDEEMEGNYIDFVVDEALDEEEEQYLFDKLNEDNKLSMIFDKVIETASEFSGSGSIQGPGSAVSDSIPARLSDGEFVMTSKAANQIGPDNLQGMMEEAEAVSDENDRRIMQAGGYVEVEEDEGIADEDIRASIKPTKTKAISDSLVDKELKKAMLSQSPRFSLFNR